MYRVENKYRNALERKLQASRTFQANGVAARAQANLRYT